MSKILFISFVFILLSVTANSKTKNDREKDKLVGAVKSIKEIQRFVNRSVGASSDFDPNNDILHSYSKEYNLNGQITEFIEQNDNGSLKERRTFTYNIQGNLIKFMYYDSVGLKFESVVPENKKRKVTLKDTIDGGSFYISKYDNQGNLVEYSIYNNQEELLSKMVWLFDKNGHLKLHALYSGDKSLEFKKCYKYNNKGDQIEEKNYDAQNELYIKTISEYDEKGNRTELNEYVGSGDLSSKTIYQYIFDKEGNWVKMTAIGEGKANFTIEREIEYY